MRFRKILVVAHGEVEAGPALRRAAALADREGARLVVMDAIQPLPEGAALPPGATRRELARRIVQQRSRELGREVAWAGGRRAHVLVRTGTPFMEVIRAVLRRGFGLVIKPTEDETFSRSLIFGSTDLHLLRKCPCPVWLLPPGAEARCREIVAAVDPHPGGPESDTLNADILAVAAQLAREERGILRVVHAWHVIAEEMLRGGYRVPRDILAQMGRQTREVHRRRLAALLRRAPLDGIPVRVHLVRGDPRVRIPRLVRSRRADLLVMGTLGRTGLAGLLIGNTAESVLAQVRCSVLALKPRDFVSPVGPRHRV